MKTETIAAQRWEDMVFEHRNKAYGAYFIRRIYSKNVILSVLFTIVFLGLVIAYPSIVAFIKSQNPDPPIDARKLTTVSLDQPPPITPNQPPPPKLDVPPPIKTIKYVAPKVTKEEVPDEEELPTQEELKQVEVSDVTTEGPTEVVFEEPVQAVVEQNDDDKIFTAVEQPAEYPGGLQELSKFLQKNIRYPSTARRMGVDGRVYVQFVVNKEGKISDVTVIKGLSADCDKEALRLIGLMPSWRPGKQNGRPVNSRFVLPIYFKIEI